VVKKRPSAGTDASPALQEHPLPSLTKPGRQ
jgi:hypothetical protein